MNRVIRTLLASDAFMILSAGMFAPLYALFVDEIGGDILTAGWTYATFAITTGVFILIVSRFEEHMKREELMIPAGYFLYSVGILGYLLVQTPMHLFFVQLITGLAEGLKKPAWDGLYSAALDPGAFTTEWGYEEAQNKIFTALAALFGGFIAYTFGFKVLFLIMFFFALCSFFMSLKIIKASRSSDKPDSHHS